MFRLDHTAGASSDALISLRGETTLPPAFLVKQFGKHDGGDGIRSSGGWTFVSESGEVFTVYEYRCTALSNGRGSGSPTVRQFWSSWEPVKLHIGGARDSDWESFRRWLQAEYRAFRKAQKAEQGAAADGGRNSGS
jgi:hypothetical protein